MRLMWILIILWICSFGCIPHLLLLNKRPTATLAWLWALLLFPGIGALFYLAVGTERVRRRRRRRKRTFRRKKRLAGAQAAWNGPCILDGCPPTRPRAT